MKTRIDHATVVTPRGDQVAVLENTSVTFEDGRITHVGPSASYDARAADELLVSLGEYRGRPLGSILIRLGKVTREQVVAALDRQKAGHGVIGQILLDMGLVSEADIEHALEIQAGREPAEIIDGRNCLLIPGLVNTHHHLFQSLTRCMPAVQNATLFEWLTTLYPVWRELGYDALRQAATVSIAELLMGGCTTTSDHQYLFPLGRDASIEAVLEAADALGIRIHACRGSMTVGASGGGLPPDECTEAESSVLADCARVIERYHDPKPMAMRRIDLAPCAPFSISADLLEQTRAMAVERNVLLHTHAAETLDEERYCLETFGVRPIEFLHRHGWLGPNVYLAHCVHLNEEEIALLAATQTGVAHCPSSNMRLGSGMAPIRRLLDAGARVGLGVDGSSSNDCGNLLLEARQALLVQRIREHVRALSPADAFRLATVGGAAVLNRPELGRIEVGQAADLVLYRADDIALAGAVAQDPLGALILCQPPRPERVVINGKTVLKSGLPLGIDIARTVADFNQLVREIFRSAKSS
ncbi:MAG TPA: 8-oxoguanine deaminase [Phycisphaerae bacterium]|nr:8-oxoguanine deaminase [Phycisphaerae bacterium]HQA45164.1 8-oxoguanine deaminase [Phycisphaerae bacterium]HQE44569.1 8-oxoguanine deaminase [Phycisphaerae bacterium]